MDFAGDHYRKALGKRLFYTCPLGFQFEFLQYMHRRFSESCRIEVRLLQPGWVLLVFLERCVTIASWQPCQ